MDLNQGKAPANTAFNPSINAINAQAPAIQQLYSTLVQSLNNSVAQGAQQMAPGIQQRGASSPAMIQQLNGMLQQASSLQGSQLNANRAQALAQNQQQAGVATADRAMATGDFAKTNLEERMAAQENAYKSQQIERTAQAEQLQNQRSFDIQKARKSYRDAQAARESASKSLKDLSESDLKRAVRLNLNAVSVNGHAGPADLAGALKIYRAAGLSDEKFWSEFQGFWDPDNGSYDSGFRYHMGR